MGRRDVGARLRAAGVAEQLYVAELDLVQGGGGIGGCGDVQAVSLGSRDGLVVNLYRCRSDGVNMFGGGAG